MNCYYIHSQDGRAVAVVYAISEGAAVTQWRSITGYTARATRTTDTTDEVFTVALGNLFHNRHFQYTREIPSARYLWLECHQRAREYVASR
jgi:hypothetical protein